MIKMICFDMDGTIADLYGVEGWLPMLQSSNPTPYRVAKPLVDMNELVPLLTRFQALNIQIRILTWLSIDSTEEYKRKVRIAKLGWLEEQGFIYNNFHGIQHGTKKHGVIKRYLAKGETAILIDDDDKVRAEWSVGATINPKTANIIKELKKIL
jgi:hypothetical protein